MNQETSHRPECATIISIGFRVVSDRRVNYTIILSGERYEFLAIDHINVPAALDLPRRLSFVRHQVISLIEQYGAKRAALKITEHNADADRDRLYIEGVIQEAFAGCGIEASTAGVMASLGALIGLSSAEFKTTKNGGSPFEHFPDIDAWKARTSEERESVLAAFAALEL